MLCSRCQHVNPVEHRYCGMCGIRLDKNAIALQEPVNEPVAEVPVREPLPEYVAVPESGHSNASILGLDAPVRREIGRRRSVQEASSSIHSPSFLETESSRDVSYLFE